MCASSNEDEFFDRKRPWSHIKDEVVGCYMPPYLNKVKGLRHKILLVDAFAGPGIYEGEDVSARYGSPLIIAREAEKYVPNDYVAFFFNKRKKHHTQLAQNLLDMGLPPQKAIAVHGDSRELLKILQGQITNQTLFVYLDPFGLSVPFEILQSLLERGRAVSTELVINLSMPGIYRLAGRWAVYEGRSDAPVIRRNHSLLTQVLGGEWWRDILLDTVSQPEAQAWELIEAYTNQLRKFLPYAGYCPVRERWDGPIKYFITFCSRHIDALTLHNDTMCRAYNSYMEKSKLAGLTLFEQLEPDWRNNRPPDILRRLDIQILTHLKSMNSLGQKPKRKELWEAIVTAEFRQYMESEFRQRVALLHEQKHLEFEDVRGTKRLNDDSRLFIPLGGHTMAAAL
jgi:three-Cys-motif partner protein